MPTKFEVGQMAGAEASRTSAPGHQRFYRSRPHFGQRHAFERRLPGELLRPPAGSTRSFLDGRGALRKLVCKHPLGTASRRSIDSQADLTSTADVATFSRHHLEGWRDCGHLIQTALEFGVSNNQNASSGGGDEPKSAWTPSCPLLCRSTVRGLLDGRATRRCNRRYTVPERWAVDEE